MLKKYLLLFFTALLLIGCGQGADQLQDNHFMNTDTKSAVIQEDKNKQNDSSLSELKVHYIDVGQADAALFQYTHQHENYTILYDTGNWNRNDVVNYLASENISYIDLIIISHPHADHIGQLADIVKTYEVGEVWLSGNTSSSKVFQRSVEAIMASDADYYEPRMGEKFEVGPMEIEVLHPKKLTGDLNEDSISLRFIYGDMKFIFTGDAYKRQEVQMIHNSMDIDADILQLGHHGSNTSSDSTFLQTVDPDVAIYSAGQDNSYGHPHDEVISRIQSLGIDLYGTDINGTIIVSTNGKNYDILTKEDGTISPKNTESLSNSK